MNRARAVGRRSALRCLPGVALVLVAGCGVPGTGPESAGAAATGARSPGTGPELKVYLLTPQGTWPALRPAPPGAGPQQALDALLSGPDRAERARGLTTALPMGRYQVKAWAAGRGTVEVALPWVIPELDHLAVNQLVCTAASAPGVPGGLAPAEVLVRIHESGLAGQPWPVRCDATGAAVPESLDRRAGRGRDHRE